MGNPLNYSLNLPQRCLRLLNTLWPDVQNIRDPERPDLGSLSSTFIISMSMPIINFPIERISINKNPKNDSYANDREINHGLTEEIDRIERGKFKDCPFFVEGSWSFVSHDTMCPPNIAKGLPEDIADKLDSPQAIKDAADMPASQWRSVLRNALAHSGIAYLDEEGKSTYNRSVKMFAFVSEKLGKEDIKRRKSVTGIYILRIREDEYLTFLRLWVAWLEKSGVAEAAEAA